MKIAGIIAEYNPFHNGHALQIWQTRQAKATHIVAVMSGNFVQRGDVALFSKWVRAKACVKSGVDLVIELPTPFAMAPARDFAYAGVFLLNQLGIEMLSFGSECGDIKKLQQAAHYVEVAEQSEQIAYYLKQGNSYPKSRALAVQALYGADWANLIHTPNNLLGIEYIKSIWRLNRSIEPFTISRVGAAHDQVGTQNITSASHIRTLLLQGQWEQSRRYLPDTAWSCYQLELAQKYAPCCMEQLDAVLLYRLRTSSPKELVTIADMTEGFENRVWQAGRQCHSFAECIDFLVTKRYSRARIRRILWNILLGINQDDFSKQPQYLRVLAANERGIALLRQARKVSQITISSKFANLVRAGFTQAAFEATATDIYALTSPVVQPANREYIEPFYLDKMCK